MPNPGRLFQTFNAYQQTAAMQAAIELDVFTAIGDRQTTAEQIAQRAGAAETTALAMARMMAQNGVSSSDITPPPSSPPRHPEDRRDRTADG